MSDHKWTEQKINWVKLPIPPDVMKQFTSRSNFKGLLQSLGFLALLTFTGSLSYYFFTTSNWVSMVIALYLHGTFFAFMPGLAMHELIHNTVFKNRWLNKSMIILYGLLAWVMNPYAYKLSHRRHHLYTLHNQQDGEDHAYGFSWKDKDLWLSFFTVIYIRYFLKHFMRLILLQPQGVGCNGPFLSDWEHYVLIEKSTPKEWRIVKSWAVVCLLTHLIFTILAIYTGHWFLIIVVTLVPFYGGYWYVSLIGTHMHTAVEDNVADWRKCCRSIKLDPFSSFLYWHMEHHVEHHMYAAIPCYNLKKFSQYLRNNFSTEEFPCAKPLLETLNHCSMHSEDNSNTGPRFKLP